MVARGVVFPSMHCVAHEFWEKLLKKESCSQGNLKEAALSNTRLQSRNAHALVDGSERNPVVNILAFPKLICLPLKKWYY